MSHLPGKKWRVLAHQKSGEQVTLRNAGQFDELVVDSWLHIEQMTTRTWWMQLGPLYVLVTLNADGSTAISIERDYEARATVEVSERVAGESVGPTWWSK